MQLAKSIMLKSSRLCFLKTFLLVLFISIYIISIAQDNSPYSRYGLGDLSPGTNITNRNMGGISAAYSDVISVNFSNPASYSQFQTIIEQRSKKVAMGRVVLDAGINIGNRSLIAPNTTSRFTSSNALFSYLQIGLPIRKNWGMSFGLRPLSRVSYRIDRTERLIDPNTGNYIDSAITHFSGSGGTYLPTIGTGFGFSTGKGSMLSAGINMGYLFGTRETKALRSIIDTVIFYSSDHTTTSSIGGLFFNAGLQFADTLSNRKGKFTILRLGFSGNWQQTIKASQNVLRQTFTRGSANEELQIDSVYQQTGIPGNIIYPSTYKAGFIIQHDNANSSGWLLGADYSIGKWSNYRFFGQTDSVQNNWMINVGGQISPRATENYFSKVAYRFGFFTGADYIKVQNKLPVFGLSFGLGLPIPNYNRLSPNQFSLINIGFEYSKRGNNNNLLKENTSRLSIGFNFTDLWFGKKKYD